MIPKDFQEATAERIFEIFRDEGQNHILLADEVGLGKTEIIVAFGDVAKERVDFKKYVAVRRLLAIFHGRQRLGVVAGVGDGKVRLDARAL